MNASILSIAFVLLFKFKSYITLTVRNVFVLTIRVSTMQLVCFAKWKRQYKKDVS